MSQTKAQTAATTVTWAGVLIALCSLVQVLWTTPPWFLKSETKTTNEAAPTRMHAEIREFPDGTVRRVPVPNPPDTEPPTIIDKINEPIPVLEDPIVAMSMEQSTAPRDAVVVSWGALGLLFGLALMTCSLIVTRLIRAKLKDKEPPVA